MAAHGIVRIPELATGSKGRDLQGHLGRLLGGLFERSLALSLLLLLVFLARRGVFDAEGAFCPALLLLGSRSLARGGHGQCRGRVARGSNCAIQGGKGGQGIERRRLVFKSDALPAPESVGIQVAVRAEKLNNCDATKVRGSQNAIAELHHSEAERKAGARQGENTCRWDESSKRSWKRRWGLRAIRECRPSRRSSQIRWRGKGITRVGLVSNSSAQPSSGGS